MSRYEQNVYFEQLVSLKLRPLGPDDLTSVISIEDVIVYAEAVMLATELELETVEAEERAVVVPQPAAAPATEASAAAPTGADESEADASADRSHRSRRLMDGWFGPARDGRPEAESDDRT